MGATSVEPQQLKNAGTKLTEYATTFEEIYQNLFQQAETMGEAWVGDDNLAFVEQIKGISTKLKQMADKLRTDGETLTKQAQNYDDRRTDNISQVSKLGQ